MKKCTFVYLLIILFSSLPALAASFTADLVMTKKGKTETGKFYLLNQSYRMDLVEEGKPIAVIADKQKNIHRFLDMKEKVFFDIPSDDFNILSNDPFKASEYMISKYDAKVQRNGSEKISGFVCEKQDFFANDEHFLTKWVSTEFGFPLKLVTYYEGKEYSITELKAVRNVRLEKDLFVPPVGFKQVEEPGAEEKRKHERLKKAEEAFPGLKKVETTQAPCYVKIANGGELHIQTDTHRKAYLEIINQVQGESEFEILPYCNGKPSENRYETSWKLKGIGDRGNFDYNDDFAQKAESYLVDEVRIRVNKGLVYAMLRQFGEDRKDSYNSGGQTDHGSDPKRPLTIRITGDNPLGDKTTGKMLLVYGKDRKSEKIPFTIATGETQKWEYPADNGIKTVILIISKGEGRAKISLIQPPDPDKVASKQAAAKTTPKPEHTPKAKVINEFTVTHPTGTSKLLKPGKDLLITVTGLSDGARGDVELFADPEKTQKIDHFGFTLKKGQEKSRFSSRDAHAVWARVMVYKGSFTVKLDQSPGVKATMKPKPKTTSAAKTKTTVKPKQSSVPVAKAVKPATATDAILNGEVPLYNGARVLKSSSSGPYTKAQLQAEASPQDIVDFYKDAMAAKGWVPGMAMVQGNKGVLMFKQSNRQLVFSVKGQGNSSKIDVTLINQQ